MTTRHSAAVTRGAVRHGLIAVAGALILTLGTSGIAAAETPVHQSAVAGSAKTYVQIAQTRRAVRQTRREHRRDMRQNRREHRQDMRKARREHRQDMREKRRERIQEMRAKRRERIKDMREKRRERVRDAVSD